MEENTQNNSEINTTLASNDENKETSTETENPCSEQQTDENETADDFNNTRSRSGSESNNYRSQTRSESEDDGGGDDEEEEDDDASVVLEREEGDGQESTPNRKVDDDEDKRNPQYIPKKGTFYEHDDRCTVEEGEEESEEKPEVERTEKEVTGKKKIWTEKEADKWSHDRYIDNEQAPKSRQELIAIYGYDIRNEEGPPRARRRRRYGRGPNKYTRNWEDEEAYSKPTNVSVKPVQRKPRTKPGQDEFPPLNPQDKRSKSKSSELNNLNISNSGNSTSEDVNWETNNKQDGKENRDNRGTVQNRPQQDTRNDNISIIQDQENNEVQQKEMKMYQYAKENRDRGGRTPNKRYDETMKTSLSNNVRGVTKTRGFFKNGGRGGGFDSARLRNQKPVKSNETDEYSDYILSQNFTNKSLSQQQDEKLQNDMAKMSLSSSSSQPQQKFNSGASSSTTNTSSGSGANRSGKFNTNSNNNNNAGGNRQTSVPPRLQQEQKGSKRYSSLRQRSLPETAASTFGPQPSYYQPEYVQQTATQPHVPRPQHSIHSQVPTTTTPQMISVAPSQPLNPIPHPGPPANGAPLMPPPPQFAPQPYVQPPQAFMQSAVAPGVAPFLPQQAPPPQIINYAQPQFTNQFGNYQHQQFNPVNQAQPTELYQPQSGITYYSTQNQHVVPRIPPKRVKAAIPIVPPPELEHRGRGRLPQCEQSSPGHLPDNDEGFYSQQTETSVTVQQ